MQLRLESFLSSAAKIEVAANASLLHSATRLSANVSSKFMRQKSHFNEAWKHISAGKQIIGRALS